MKKFTILNDMTIKLDDYETGRLLHAEFYCQSKIKYKVSHICNILKYQYRQGIIECK